MEQPGMAAMRHHFAPLRAFMDNPAVTEIVIQKPGEFGVEADGAWTWHVCDNLTFDRLDGMAMLAAGLTGQTLSSRTPRCSTLLPGGLRVQVARPPQVPEGTVSFTIRKRATNFVPTLEWLNDHDYFSELPQNRDWVAWWHKAVEDRKTIIISGNTGSGKTTTGEALLRAVPRDERLVVIERTPEWTTLPHRNLVMIYYGASGDGADAERAATSAVEDALRQRPDRIMIGEVRSGGEAWAYLRAEAAGHPGGIMTVHSLSAATTIDSLSLIMRQSGDAANLHDDVIRAQLKLFIGVIAHCKRNPYRMTDVIEIK